MVAKLRTQKGIVIDYELVDGANHFWTEHLPEVEEPRRRLPGPPPGGRPGLSRNSKAVDTPGDAILPPVMGCRHARRAGKADRQALQTSRRQVGEGLRLDGVAAPADVLRPDRPGTARASAMARISAGLCRPPPQTISTRRPLAAGANAQRHGLGGEGGQGGGAVLERQARRPARAEKS